MKDLDWQPRETAPSTGEHLLVKYEYSIPNTAPDYSVVRWNGDDFVGVCDGALCKSSEGDTWVDYYEPYFTHWYPLETQKAHPQSRG